MNKISQKFLQFIALFVLATQAVADEGVLYQIEVLAFEHNDPARFGLEDWPRFVGQLDYEQVKILAADASGKHSNTLQLVPEVDYLLAKNAESIAKLDNYRIITHKAWLQDLDEEQKEVKVHLEEREPFLEQPVNLEGVVTLKNSNNLLYTNLDFIYKVQQDNSPEFVEYRITKSNRMKLKEVYYLDHPLVSFMITVAPYMPGANKLKT